ncbi:MAG: hypothetical protein V4722_08810 [Bacteroidota bacterium]
MIKEHLMYEHKSQPLAPKKVYYDRLRRNMLFSFVILFICLSIGTLGFKFTCTGVALIDAFHNASMLLSGMGPVLDVNKMGVGAKVFSSCYALFSGVAFITTIGILVAPAVHRFFHRLHLEGK